MELIQMKSTSYNLARHLKIQNALPILLNNNYNISEVAFEVGYNDPKYFTKCFRKELGITPTEYRECGRRNLQKSSIIEERFVASLAEIVEDDLANIFNSLDMFASKMSVSRSTLHRRVKSQTGLSPLQFMQRIRIRKAEQLLSKNNCPILEVAYKVGFSDPKHFSRCFKLEYGVTPSEFKKMQNDSRCKII